jgi:3-oxoacyl-[acyl-carrier-protein] synthase III
MNFNKTVLDCFAYVEPEQFFTSEELEAELLPIYERLKLPQGRLELQTQIKRRGFWPKGTRPSSIATMAAKKCLEQNSIDPLSIDLLIHASVCRDFLEPATASVIHHHLGLSQKTQIYDLSNACLGVLNAMITAAGFIEAGLIKNALVVSGENAGPLIFETIQFLNSNQELTRKTFKPFFANLTIGSAGVALYLCEKSLAKNHHELKLASILTDSSHNELCQGDGNSVGLMMQTDSEELLHAGIKLAQDNYAQFKKRCDSKFHPSKFIAHQVGIAHETMLFDTLGLDLKQSYKTYDLYGNTGSAACPLTLMKAVENKFINQDDEIALLGIGSGLSSVMLGVKW